VSFERVLITGGGGALASDLAQRLDGRGEVAARSHAELDVSDPAALEAAFGELEPTLVLNCAAAHNAEVCEAEPELAFAVNSAAVQRLARHSAQTGATLVTVSTNYVFDGERPEPYGEDEAPGPRSVYSISKLAGEHAALAYAPGALVVRTAGLFGLCGSAAKGGNFVTRILERGRERGALQVVADQLLTPTFTADLAEAIIGAVEAGVAGRLHLTNSGSCSWHEFTEAIVELAGLEVPVEAIATEQERGGGRPFNGVLARPRADAAGLPALRPWRDALADYMQRAGLAAVSA